MSSERFAELQRRYREGDTPWDDALPPPEIVALGERLEAGRALDLGCGSGRACVFLAQRGWSCDGVDFIPEAVARAAERVAAAGVGERVRLHTASVTALDFLDPPYDLAIDVGCLHGLEADLRPAYAAGLMRLVRPGGLFALFAHLRRIDEEGGIAMPEIDIMSTFSSGFGCEHIARGITQVGERVWESGWFYLRRTMH
jgi:SAM-dependent methyltransferase